MIMNSNVRFDISYKIEKKMKNKKSNKKYTVDPQLTDTISNQTYISDIR
jgi:hypothetical protein